MTMRRILITGATGFIGAHLLIRLLQEDDTRIRATFRSAAAFDELKLIASFYGIGLSRLFNEVEWVKVDLLDKVALDRAMFDIDEVYHCAAVVSFDSASAQKLLQTNVEGTGNIVKACLRKEVGKLCFISSIGALNGINADGMVDEDCFDKPVAGSVYSASKHYSEQEVWDGVALGLDVVILNPGIVLGPGNTRKGSLRFFDTVRKGILFYTAGVTGYVDVRDVAKAATECMNRDLFNRRMLLVSENLSYQQLLTMIAREYGKTPPFIRAGKPLLALASLFSGWKARFTGQQPKFTKETMASAVKITNYDSSRTRAQLGFDLISISETVKVVCGFNS